MGGPARQALSRGLCEPARCGLEILEGVFPQHDQGEKGSLKRG